jgi:hypothetical protein
VSPDGLERATRPLPLALLVLAGVLALLHLALPLVSMPAFASLNYNEGWNAYHAAAVFSERPLYPPPGDLFPNNYPPLSFAGVALLSRLFGDPVLWGRALSLLAFLAICTEIGLLARRASGSWRHGLFAGLLFAALLGAAYGDYVGVNDPQLLAHALVLGGGVLVTGGRSPARIASAVLLMGLGGLVKHNLIALPLAVTAWLWLRDRRAFARWAQASAAFLGLALLGLWLVHGGDVFGSILGVRETSLRTGAHMSADWLRSLAAPLAVGVLALREAWRDPDAQWLALYAGLGLVLGVVFTAGEGVSYNAFFDLTIALSLLGSFLLVRSGNAIPVVTLALALLLDPLLRAPHAALGLGGSLDQLAKLEAASTKDVDYLAAHEGPALCETLSLCFWAGKPAAVDLFNSRQAFWAGRADEQQLVERISRREFAVVQLISIYKNRDDLRVSAGLASALLRDYVVDRASMNGVFLRPRRGTSR